MSLSLAAATSIITALTVVAAPDNSPPPDTNRVSVSYTGEQGNFPSSDPALSDDGRVVAFTSRATNLVPGGTMGSDEVFIRDRRTRLTWQIGRAGNNHSPSISATGRYIAYVSESDASPDGEILVYDRDTEDTTRVSVSSAGAAANRGSADPAISGDGRYVTFSSSASNLVPGDTNRAYDVFVHDRETHVTTRVSLSTGDGQGDGNSGDPSISRNGRYITYYSAATNLVAGDTNGFMDVFVRDQRAGTTTRVSVSSTGAQPSWDSFTPDISADGRRITFMSYARDLVAGDTNTNPDIFLRDLATGTTTLVSVAASGELANDSSATPVISADGTHIAYTTYADNLVAGDTNQANDVLVHDLVTGSTTRASVSHKGAQADQSSWAPAISGHGNRIAFVSGATNLVHGDTNGETDVFLYRAGPLSE